MCRAVTRSRPAPLCLDPAVLGIVADPPRDHLLGRVRIAHPAAGRAGELLAHGRPAGAEAVLEDALEAMAGPDSGVRMGWFKPQAHHPRRRPPIG